MSRSQTMHPDYDCILTPGTAWHSAASCKSFCNQHLAGSAGLPDADVSVTLWNIGEDAYKPQAFGNVIQIDRHISGRGGSTFKLKNSEGKTVATGQAELKLIMAHFQIDASNPVVCLPQVTPLL